MKKSIVFAAALIAGILVSASAGAKNGIEVGYLNSFFRLKATGEEAEKPVPLSGFTVSLVKDMKLVAGLSIQPGLSYNYLNSRENSQLLGFDISGSVTDHLLNVPVHLKYTFDIIPAIGVYAFAGPTFAVGLSAREKVSVNGELLGFSLDGSLIYDSYSGKVESENLSDEIVEIVNQNISRVRTGRFDVLVGGGIGVNIIKFISIRAGFDYGLINRIKGDLADTATLNRMQVYVSAGISF